MIHTEYYDILGLTANCTLEEIKKAYRQKARLYHPDINHEPNAKELFIKATEAYDFLRNNYDRGSADEKEFNMIMDEWRKYRQDRSRQRAQYYARKSYINFKNSKYYKTTRILNSSSIIFNFAISIMVLTYTIMGYIIKLRNPVPEDPPATVSFIILLILSLILLSFSFLYLLEYIRERKKQKRRGRQVA